MTGWLAFDELCEEWSQFDLGVRLEGGSEYAWSCELRVTINPNNPDGPDQSLVFLTAGHEDGETALLAALTAAGEARETIFALAG